MSIDRWLDNTILCCKELLIGPSGLQPHLINLPQMAMVEFELEGTKQLAR